MKPEEFKRLSQSIGTYAQVARLTGLHPVHVESCANGRLPITERTEKKLLEAVKLLPVSEQLSGNPG